VADALKLTALAPMKVSAHQVAIALLDHIAEMDADAILDALF
jgi:hypothetical protein